MNTTVNITQWQQPDAIRACLAGKRIAIVGLSSNPSRPSYDVADYLLGAGFEVIPVNPRENQVLGQKCYPDLISVPGTIDLVDVFRQSDAVMAIAKSAIEVGAKGLWLQLGVFDSDALVLAHNAGLVCVADLCTKVEHRRLTN